MPKGIYRRKNKTARSPARKNRAAASNFTPIIMRDRRITSPPSKNKSVATPDNPFTEIGLMDSRLSEVERVLIAISISAQARDDVLVKTSSAHAAEIIHGMRAELTKIVKRASEALS